MSPAITIVLAAYLRRNGLKRYFADCPCNACLAIREVLMKHGGRR